MSPTYTYRCQHGHEVYAARPMESRHYPPEGNCPESAGGGPMEDDCVYKLIMSQTSDPVVKGGTPKHYSS